MSDSGYGCTSISKSITCSTPHCEDLHQSLLVGRRRRGKVPQAPAGTVALGQASFFLVSCFAELIIFFGTINSYTLYVHCADRVMKKLALQRWKTDLSQVLQIYLGEKHCLGCLVAPCHGGKPRPEMSVFHTLTVSEWGYWSFEKCLDFKFFVLLQKTQRRHCLQHTQQTYVLTAKTPTVNNK